MTNTTIKDVLQKYLSKMTEIQITNYLDRVWDQDVVSDAREHYEDDVKSQLDYYLQSSSHLEASLEWIMEIWIENLFQKSKRLKFEDLKPWMVVFSESLRARFNVWYRVWCPNSLQITWIELRDVTKYAEWQKSWIYSKHEIDDNFFHISKLI